MIEYNKIKPEAHLLSRRHHKYLHAVLPVVVSIIYKELYIYKCNVHLLLHIYRVLGERLVYQEVLVTQARQDPQEREDQLALPVSLERQVNEDHLVLLDYEDSLALMDNLVHLDLEDLQGLQVYKVLKDLLDLEDLMVREDHLVKVVSVELMVLQGNVDQEVGRAFMSPEYLCLVHLGLEVLNKALSKI